MPVSVQHHALSKGRELTTLLVLCAVQFTHILDFMIMMPLGAQLMRVFAISPAEFTRLVAAYGLAAAISGFTGGFFLDRFDRKRSLLVLYAGFGLATLACGLAPTHHTLLAARLAAGAFGGLAGSLVTAMVGDIIPPARRGRAMSYVMTAFPLASVLGVPAGLVLAGRFGWHAPFFLLAGCATANVLLAAFALPHLATAVKGHQPLRQMRDILAHGVHRRAFAVGTVLVMSGGVIIPFLAPSFVANVGLDETSQLPLAYAVGGIATAFSTPFIGWLSDRMDRLRLLVIMSAGAVVVVLFITRLGPSSVLTASLMMALFMVTMSGRFAPAMTMITNAVEARYRGGFMSVNAALQQAASGGASLLAGVFVTRDATGHLVGLPLLGYVSAGFFGLTVLLSFALRAAAPHVAKPAPRDAHPPPPPAEAAA
ncbi:MAG TPA: MFS transporter [Lacunisphaera sp.]|jgi:DHA1 family inner membrane transport protein|nr:MFS transporter [Lacunisphaera sp.]